jgi:hypothetical protein
MKVQTRAVRNRLIGGARQALKKAAGSNQVLSKTEAKKLPKDLARAAETVRTQKGRVSVNDAVDAYASKVSKVLAAVDTRAKGDLSEAEAKRIRDPELRSSVLDARSKLLGGVGGGSGATTGSGITASALASALSGAMVGLDGFCESGDHGVNVSMRKVPGRTLTEVLSKVHLDPAAPWTHGETALKLSPAADVGDTIDAFTSTAKDSLEAERDDMPDVVETFTNAVKAQFGALKDVRLATGGDLGGWYLIGRAKDGYVAVAVQPYSD